MKRIFRNWFAGFAAISVTNLLYINIFGQGNGAMFYALQSSKIFLVLCIFFFCGYLIFSKKEELDTELSEKSESEKKDKE